MGRKSFSFTFRDSRFAFALKEIFHGTAVGNVDLVKGKVVILFQDRKACLLKVYIIVIIQVVNANYLFALFEQPLREVKADESSRRLLQESLLSFHFLQFQ